MILRSLFLKNNENIFGENNEWKKIMSLNFEKIMRNFVDFFGLKLTSFYQNLKDPEKIMNQY